MSSTLYDRLNAALAKVGEPRLSEPSQPQQQGWSEDWFVGWLVDGTRCVQVIEIDANRILVTESDDPHRERWRDHWSDSELSAARRVKALLAGEKGTG